MNGTSGREYCLRSRSFYEGKSDGSSVRSHGSSGRPWILPTANLTNRRLGMDLSSPVPRASSDHVSSEQIFDARHFMRSLILVSHHSCGRRSLGGESSSMV